MTLPEVGRLFDYWKESPPLHMVVGRFLGVDGYKPKSEVKEPTFNDLKMLWHEFHQI